MKLSVISLVTALSLSGAAPVNEIEKRVAGVPGFDISHYQGKVNFKAAYDSGARFVIIKVSPFFSSDSHTLRLLQFPHLAGHHDGKSGILTFRTK